MGDRYPELVGGRGGCDSVMNGRRKLRLLGWLSPVAHRRFHGDEGVEESVVFAV